MPDLNILYVEDAPTLAQIVKDTLERKGYTICLVDDGARVIETLQQFQPQLCILDVMLPHVDGFSLGEQIRSLQADLPIIYLTAKNRTADVVQGFKSGGNDYLRKPFSMEELMVRIDNLLALRGRAKGPNPVDEIPIGAYRFYPQKLLLKSAERELKLTYRESEVLQVFAQNQNGVVRKKHLLLGIWGDDTLSNSRNLDVYITKLRDYLSGDPQIEILTLRGVGYQFNVG